MDKAVFTTPAGNPKLVYTSLAGDSLAIEYRPTGTTTSIRSINGKNVDINDPQAWPLLRNPWMQQEFRGDTLAVHYDHTTFIYDLANWEISEIGEPPTARRTARAANRAQATGRYALYSPLGRLIARGPGSSTWRAISAGATSCPAAGVYIVAAQNSSRGSRRLVIAARR